MEQNNQLFNYSSIPLYFVSSSKHLSASVLSFYSSQRDLLILLSSFCISMTNFNTLENCYKNFISSCTLISGENGIGNRREVNLISGFAGKKRHRQIGYSWWWYVGECI